MQKAGLLAQISGCEPHSADLRQVERVFYRARYSEQLHSSDIY